MGIFVEKRERYSTKPEFFIAKILTENSSGIRLLTSY